MAWYNVLESLAVTAASASAILALWKWRVEHVGRKRIDLAEEALARFYEAVDDIHYIRNPWEGPEEGGTRLRRDNEPEDETRVLDEAYVAYERLLRVQDTFHRIRAMQYRFRALLGKNAEKPFLDLQDVVRDIRIAANRKARYLMREVRGQLRDQASIKKNLERLHEAEAVLWEGLSEPDAINERLEGIIREIEKVCRPTLVSASALYRPWPRFGKNMADKPSH